MAKGINDYKKGNRTTSNRDPSSMIAFSKQRSEDIKRYREMAEKDRKGKVYTQERLTTIYVGIKKYMERQQQEERPLTVSGLIIASGINNPASWHEAKGGMYDYRLNEYLELHPEAEANVYIDNIPCLLTDTSYSVDDLFNNDDSFRQKKALDSIIMIIPYSIVIKKALMLQAEQVEERLYQKGRVGDIFALKAQHNWREDTPNTVNNTLVIADQDQARRAIELLK